MGLIRLGLAVPGRLVRTLTSGQLVLVGETCFCRFHPFWMDTG